MPAPVLFSISGDITSGLLNIEGLTYQLNQQSVFPISIKQISDDDFEVHFSENLSTEDGNTLLTVVQDHDGKPAPYPKIKDLMREAVQELDLQDVDYTLQLTKNLYPKRYFTQGELRKVEWYCDKEMQDLALRVDIVYTRDAFGFATERTTTRTWINTDGNDHEDAKVTHKDYTINPIDQIKEGKRRRGNIVDDIQLPTLSFMVEVMSVAPYNLSQGAILLTGRDFMDRHELEFSKFIDNSSSVTDVNDPNFGKKTVVVAFENAANSTDPWLKEKPLQLDPTGNTSIEDYLVAQFSI